MNEGTTLTSRVVYFKRCLACQHKFASIFRNAKCPRCSARSEVYGIQEVDTPTSPDVEHPPPYDEGCSGQVATTTTGW